MGLAFHVRRYKVGCSSLEGGVLGLCWRLEPELTKLVKGGVGAVGLVFSLFLIEIDERGVWCLWVWFFLCSL